jgi:hypothetical protein
VVSSKDSGPVADVPTFDGSDAPVRSLSEDQLGRRGFAEALAAEILAAPVARGYVMGLTGPWGSGKTSVLNMAVEALGDEAIVVEFNPWMFSGTEALVSRFFAEIGAQLGKRGERFKAIAGKIADYGQLLSPLAVLAGAGAAVGAASGLLKKLSDGPSVLEQHQDLRDLLGKLDKRVVVVIDDVDRLRPAEVLDIVRLVRLVGDFPNTLYLLAFDRHRVEECLGEGDDARGRAYLEKIVQVTHDVPAPREPDVTGMFIAGLVQMADTLPAGPLDPGDWQNILTFVIRPILQTPRQVQRLLGSLSMTMRLVGDEVAFADLAGIEAVRVLRPALFEAIISVADQLAAGRPVPGAGGYRPGRNVADSPVAAMDAADPELAAAVCRWLFPAALQHFENTHYGSDWEATWRQQRKIASAPVFRFYLERQLPDGVVPAKAVDQAVACLSDSHELRRFLDLWTGAELIDLIERMNAPAEQLPVSPDPGQDPARIAAPVLLDLLPQLPEDPGAFQPRGSTTARRIVHRLIRRIPEERTRSEIVRAIFAGTSALSGRLILLRVVQRQTAGSGLVDAATAARLEDRLRADLMALSPEDFAGLDRIAILAAHLAETEAGKASLRALASDDRAVLSLLAGCVSEKHGQELGAAAVEVTKVLPWTELTGWLGQDTLMQRTADVRAGVTGGRVTASGDELAALALAASYATGNPPQSSWDRLARQHLGTGPNVPVTAEDSQPPGEEDKNGAAKKTATISVIRPPEPARPTQDPPANA